MRMTAAAVVLVGIAWAAPHGVAAQAASGERFQAATPAAPALPAPAVTPAPAVEPAAAPAPAPPATEPSAVARFGPSADGARLLAPARATTEEPRLAHTPAYSRRDGIPLMIVGGALFLAGAIIDDRAGDAVMVAGVVVAAIGLYQYLQ